MTLSVQPEWCTRLPLQMQSVLLLAGRGPDGIPKDHPCKDVHRALRATVFLAARRGRTLEWGERDDSFMSLDAFANEYAWEAIVKTFFQSQDQLPHHYYMHLMHAAEILGYKHPDVRFRVRWLEFYYECCDDLHLTAETEAEIDERLNDWDRRDW